MGTPPPGSEPNRVPVDKSPVLAFLLTLFLGPLGLLYVKVVPALVLMVVALTGYFTFGVTTAVAWIVSIVWACVEASRRHRASRAAGGPPPAIRAYPCRVTAKRLRSRTTTVRTLLFRRPAGTRTPPTRQGPVVGRQPMDR